MLREVEEEITTDLAVQDVSTSITSLILMSRAIIAGDATLISGRRETQKAVTKLRKERIMAPIFKPVNEMLDFDPKGREKLTDQLSRTLSKADSDASKDLSNEVGHALESAVHGRGWMAKAARTARITDPWYVGRTLSPWIAVVACGIETLIGAPAAICVGTCSIALSLFLLCNPHNILTRWLSIQTRIIMFVDILLLTCSLFSGSKVTFVCFLIWTLATGALCAFMNDRWLFAQNMLMNDTVRKALVQCNDTEGMKRWSDCGKREVRTFASEAGLPFDDQVLEIGYLGPWLCGYYNHHIEISKKDAEIEKRDRKIAELELGLEIDEKRMTELESELEKAERSDDLEAERARAKELSTKMDSLKNANVAMQKRIEELEAQLCEQKDINPDELLRQQVIELRYTLDDKGNMMTMRAIKAELDARGVNVSVGKIGNICKEYEEMKESA